MPLTMTGSSSNAGTPPRLGACSGDTGGRSGERKGSSSPATPWLQLLTDAGETSRYGAAVGDETGDDAGDDDGDAQGASRAACSPRSTSSSYCASSALTCSASRPSAVWLVRMSAATRSQRSRSAAPLRETLRRLGGAARALGWNWYVG